ncbi:MAG TPA: type 1 glutamine amidotransferase [Paucimonas sp.]|nr:type 1 glutamine amidotransferase [Paucimonas sp.]
MRRLRIAVFQHHPAEGPGRLAQWAGMRGHALSLFRWDHPDHVVGRLSEAPAAEWRERFDAVVALGGPQSVNDPPPWLADEMDCIAQLVARGMPVLGICLGAQMLARALGAEVRALPKPEHGWTTIRFADGSALDVLQWHEEECGLPPHAVRLAGSDACAVQAYRAPNRCIGIQFHPEWDEASVDELNRAFGPESPFLATSVSLIQPCGRERDAARHHRVQEWFFGALDGWVGQFASEC